FEDVGYHRPGHHGLHVNVVAVSGRVNIEVEAFRQCEYGVLARDIGTLQRDGDDPTDGGEVPYPGLLVGVHHLRQERADTMEDAADVDVDDTAPVGYRRVPQVAELFDPGIVDQ